MFDTPHGPRWHPLVVHGVVVVLLPLAILGTTFGDQLLWSALALLLTSALVGLQWRAERAALRRSTESTGTSGTTGGTQLTAVAAVAVLAAVACGVQVYRVGDSGARAAWGDVPSASGG